jgi:hypothetical protein
MAEDLEVRTVRRGVAIVASLLRVIGLIIVAILVIYILLVVAGANPVNGFAVFVKNAADTFSLGLSNLFLLKDPKFAVGVNYGIAAVAWLVITSIVVGLVRRVR